MYFSKVTAIFLKRGGKDSNTRPPRRVSHHVVGHGVCGVGHPWASCHPPALRISISIIYPVIQICVSRSDGCVDWLVPSIALFISLAISLYIAMVYFVGFYFIYYIGYIDDILHRHYILTHYIIIRIIIYIIILLLYYIYYSYIIILLLYYYIIT